VFYLTKQERLVLIFLAGALAVGAAARVVWGRRAPPRPAPLELTIDLSKEKGTPADLAAAAAKILNAKVDVNNAGAEELATLPGIGPAFAARIIQYRKGHPPFTKAEDLTAVPGIGPAKAGALAPHITFGPAK